jgi:hypothetical protein
MTTTMEDPSASPARQGLGLLVLDPGLHLLTKALDREGASGRLSKGDLANQRTGAIRPTPCQFGDRLGSKPILLLSAAGKERKSREWIPRLENILQIPPKPFRVNGKAP